MVYFDMEYKEGQGRREILIPSYVWSSNELEPLQTSLEALTRAIYKARDLAG